MSGRKYTIEDWRAVREALRAGSAIEAASAATRVSRSVVHRWSHMGGPPDGSFEARPIERTRAL